VNKVETAVRVVHVPTGLSAASQAERSQGKNRERAMSILKAKLIKLMEESRETEIQNLKTRVSPEWGHQIRSYVMHPYRMVKDHRTEFETSKIDDVLSGNLDGFIEAELKL
jgi:peptide chain release factor 2